ncbi:MAG: gamma-glutamyl-gamma-aminobutyrate hydrolase family protein, partial [Burkholderiales bacterium]
LEQTVAHRLLAHGALAFMVPTVARGADVSRASISMSDYVHELDGLVLQGGADVSPSSYGEEPLRPEWSGDRVRDLYEIELFWECVIQGKPVLGICRGAQLINVALGGSLYQDIGSQIEGAARHVDQDAYDQNEHEIEIVPGSGLARLFGMLRRATVNSIHHQSVKALGRGLTAEAVSPSDGVIEAIRWTGSSYAMGLQWHPEFHARAGARLLDCSPVLLDFLGNAAAARAAGTAPAELPASKPSARESG